MSPPLTVLYTAAHAEFPDTEPLGGGKAVADYLIRAWRRSAPFTIEVLSPAALGLGTRTGQAALAQLAALEYARFCRQFEQAATRRVASYDPQRCLVLSNDISEGPDFRRLAARGFRIVTIFHVDVVDYFTRFYLRNIVRPERLTRLTAWGWAPDVVQLVFRKQLDCVRHSARLVVPSEPMKQMIRRCYPFYPDDQISVLPWGNVAERVGSGDHRADRDGPRGIGENEFVLLTLSRLSPEKGIERLLAALPILDTRRNPVRLVIGGGAAYMQGQRYERLLRRQARQVSNVTIDFAGHVTGSDKTALLDRADLFISSSIHESYGLAIEEARAAGCPVISHQHYGATGKVVNCGEPAELAHAIQQHVDRGRMTKVTPAAARSDMADQLARLLQGVADLGSGQDRAASTKRETS